MDFYAFLQISLEKDPQIVTFKKHPFKIPMQFVNYKNTSNEYIPEPWDILEQEAITYCAKFSLLVV